MAPLEPTKQRLRLVLVEQEALLIQEDVLLEAKYSSLSTYYNTNKLICISQLMKESKPAREKQSALPSQLCPKSATDLRNSHTN